MLDVAKDHRLLFEQELLSIGVPIAANMAVRARVGDLGYAWLYYPAVGAACC
jgi:hypothetical protein